MREVDIYKSQQPPDVDGVIITINEAIPAEHFNRPATVPMAAFLADLNEFFTNEARTLEDALFQSLPGGTYGRLVALMLQRKAIHLGVSHKSLERKEKHNVRSYRG